MARQNATVADAYADPKKHKIFLTTPLGVASYPHLITHDDYQLKENGVYQCNTNLRFQADDEFLDKLGTMADEMFAIGTGELEGLIEGGTLKGKELNKAKENLKGLTRFTPFEDDCDDDGEPNGLAVMKMKTIVKGVNKASGESWEKEVPIFDSQNQPVKGKARAAMKLWAGSKITVAIQVVPFLAAGLKKCGVSLRIQAVQVNELAGGGTNADTFGFGVEEGGYQAETFENSTNDATPSPDESSTPQEDDDDF